MRESNDPVGTVGRPSGSIGGEGLLDGKLYTRLVHCGNFCRLLLLFYCPKEQKNGKKFKLNNKHAL